MRVCKYDLKIQLPPPAPLTGGVRELQGVRDWMSRCVSILGNVAFLQTAPLGIIMEEF